MVPVFKIGPFFFSIALLALIATPFISPSGYTIHVLILALLFASLSSSWNLISGYTGIFTFGHQAFFGLGAYCSALTSQKFGLSPWLTIWLGGLLAAGTGCLVSLPVLKIRSVPHIAIVTLAFAEIARITCSNLTDLTRGELGLSAIPPLPAITIPFLGLVTFDGADKTGFFFVFLVALLATLLVTYAILKTRFGFALRAIRGSQIAAESLGVNLTLHKTIAFAISGFIAGTLGALYAHYVMIITPSSVMGIDVMVQVVAMTLIGGIGRIHGPTVGAFVLVISLELLRDLGEYRMLIYGAVLIIITLFLPNGLTSLKPSGFLKSSGLGHRPKTIKAKGN